MSENGVTPSVQGVHAGIIDPMKFVAVTSTMAAKIFNCYPQKGRIAVGSDADIVIWNAKATRTISKDTHHHAIDFNTFEGMQVHGVPETTICRGLIVWADGQLRTVQGAGRFVPLPPDSQIVFSAVDNRGKTLEPVKVDRAPYIPSTLDAPDANANIGVKRKPLNSIRYEPTTWLNPESHCTT